MRKAVDGGHAVDWSIEEHVTLEIRQCRSQIGEKPKTRGALRALGLGKIGAIRKLPPTPTSYGQIDKVRHLVQCRMAPTTASTEKAASGQRMTESTYRVVGSPWLGHTFSFPDTSDNEYISIETYPAVDEPRLANVMWSTPFEWSEIEEPLSRLTGLLQMTGEVEFESGQDFGIPPLPPHDVAGLLDKVDRRRRQVPPDNPLLVRLDAADHALIWSREESVERRESASAIGEFALLTTKNDPDYVRLLASITGSDLVRGNVDQFLDSSSESLNRLRIGHIRTKFA